MSRPSQAAGMLQDRRVSEDSIDWRVAKLGSFINVKHGYAFGGDGITSDETPSILVTPGNFHVGGGFKSAKLKYFSGAYPQAYKLKKDDIIVTMTDLSKDGDTLGYGARVPACEHKAHFAPVWLPAGHAVAGY